MTLWEILDRKGELELKVVYDDIVRRLRDLMLRKLNPREYRILWCRFGFYDHPLSFGGIGEDLGISGARIAQVEAKARRKLQVWLIEAGLVSRQYDVVYKTHYTPCWKVSEDVRRKRIYEGKDPWKIYRVRSITQVKRGLKPEF